MEFRKAQVLKTGPGGGWWDIQFEDIKAGDIFRLFEQDGSPVTNIEGRAFYKALSDAFPLGDGKNYQVDATAIGPLSHLRRKV